MGRSRTNTTTEETEVERDETEGQGEGSNEPETSTESHDQTGDGKTIEHGSREGASMSADGPTPPLTQTESVVKTGLESGGEGPTDLERGKSESDDSPDAERTNRLNRDVKTAEAEAFTAETERSGGRDVADEELEALQKEANECQADVDAAVRRRDRARDRLDRAIEEQAVRNRASSQSVFSDHQAALNKRRRDQAEEAARVKRVQEAILGGNMPAPQTNTQAS
jgi:hypothetical protein